MSKARGLADLGNAYSDGALSNRNLIINGAMQVAQRGTSSTVNAASTAYRTVDRFEGDFFGSSWTGVNHTTEDQSTDAPDGFSRSLKFTALTSQDYSSALGSWVQYTFENQDIVGLRSGNGLKDFTISFWVKANKTGNVSVSLENDYSYSTYVTISAANTWERKTLTIPATTNNMGIDYAASPNGGDLKLKLGMGSNGSWLVDTDNQWNDATTNRGVLSPQQTNFHASVSDYIAFTGVQLEVGDTATPFEHRSYGDEIQRCMRYYYVHDYNGSGTEGPILVRYQDGANAYYASITYPVPMRAQATVAYNNGGTTNFLHKGGVRYDTGSLSVETNDHRKLRMTAVSDTTDAASPALWIRIGTITADAEL